MKTGLPLLLRMIAVAGIAAASAFTPVSARTPAEHATLDQALETDAEDLFSDAAFGVDPMVTGPVSEAFRQRQLDLGCAEARWPDIPAGCYPG